ncbi:hypothetical protein AXF42_Ash000491 [Apostasia shenzhenica]|uniref:Uncharacterized protein n=1 Tax=Apostasia shenzhenica TaxID=1088818 RepID=A0A2I0AGN8_9ASPA|nr:hypothetical protein AXF42_Ash000491 [Apostasia shenzhenica]
MHPAPVFGGIPPPNLQPPISSATTPFVPSIGTSLHAATFPGDANCSLNMSERPKKAAVPNWLREEIIKKKSASVNSGSAQPRSIDMEDADKPFTRTNQADSKSLDSSKSTEDEEDDEDEVEATRSAAINQEIKRVLTEVLLKVTDELFDEIATKVMSEDETNAEVESISAGNHKVTPPAILTPKASAKILLPLTTESSKADASIQNSSPRSPGGNILGLANYNSDSDGDGDDDDPSRGSTVLSSSKQGILSHHEEGTTKSSEIAMKDTIMSKTMNADANCGMEEISLPESIERKRDEKSNEKPSGVSETLEKKIVDNSKTGGGFRRDSSEGFQPSDAASVQGKRRHESASGERTVTEERLTTKGQILSDANQKPIKRKDDGDLDKERKTDLHRNDDNSDNYEGDKPKEKVEKRDKLNDLASGKHVKLVTNEWESHAKISSKDDASHSGRKEILKDKGEKSKDSERKSEHKREKGDSKRDGREDQSTRVGRESFKHNGRSKSPNRGRNAKDSTTSDESSERLLVCINENGYPHWMFDSGMSGIMSVGLLMEQAFENPAEQEDKGITDMWWDTWCGIVQALGGGLE